MYGGSIHENINEAIAGMGEPLQDMAIMEKLLLICMAEQSGKIR